MNIFYHKHHKNRIDRVITNQPHFTRIIHGDKRYIKMNRPTVKAVQQRSFDMTLQKYGSNELSLSEIIFYVNNLKLENTSRSTNGILKTFKNKL